MFARVSIRSGEHRQNARPVCAHVMVKHVVTKPEKLFRKKERLILGS